ncbi:MAG TPA: DUF3006 domain-containing protein [Clostridia bacterium]|nr:DUF3006 domain-containing protein [Clostridia bacterium]
MKYILDRFEGDYAVCEDENGRTTNLKRNELPSNVQEGDVLIFEDGIFIIDKEETEIRKKEIEKLFNDLIK